MPSIFDPALNDASEFIHPKHLKTGEFGEIKICTIPGIMRAVRIDNHDFNLTILNKPNGVSKAVIFTTKGILYEYPAVYPLQSEDYPHRVELHIDENTIIVIANEFVKVWDNTRDKCDVYELIGDQQFVYNGHVCDRVDEAICLFPLPGVATIGHVYMFKDAGGEPGGLTLSPSQDGFVCVNISHGDGNTWEYTLRNTKSSSYCEKTCLIFHPSGVYVRVDWNTPGTWFADVKDDLRGFSGNYVLEKIYINGVFESKIKRRVDPEFDRNSAHVMPMEIARETPETEISCCSRALQNFSLM